MSNFEENRKTKEETKKRNDTRREKIAGYFFNLSQLTFAALVLGGFTPLYGEKDNGANWYVIIAGALLTIVFARIASLILKYN